MQTTTKAKSGGCGCAGAPVSKGGCGCGGNCGGGCGCKPARLPEAAPALCSPCETASFVRPRFFAGQLLTEDDLSALIDYVVSKNRFHNSRLFGEGVVCGLLVECGPCDGQIVVDPGYALDCCGNNLVLTCKQILDIAPMIRELASHKDCGCTDPCSDPTIAQTSTPSNQDQKPTAKPCKTYCLYARYGERPDQPVAAYPVGGDCDTTSCEPTRIVEGITFELRCPTTVKRPNIHDAQACCDDDDNSEYMLRVASSIHVIADMVQHSLDPEKVVSEAKLKQLREAVDLDGFAAGVHGRDRAVLLVRYVGVVGGILARAKRLGIDLKDIVNTEVLNTNLAHASADLAKIDVEDLLPIDAALVHLFQPQSDRAARSAFQIHEANFTELIPPMREQLDIVAVKLRAAAGCGTQKIHTDCCLSDTLDRLAPAFGTSTHALMHLSDAAYTASDAIWRYYNDCDCAAINPPCPPCDDPGVLLACIEVDHCKVVRICNTVREYVYAPSTLRYWDAIDVPPSWLCCGREKREVEKPGRVAIQRHLDLELERRAGIAMQASSPSLRAYIAPSQTARMLAAPHELQIVELNNKIALLERKVNSLLKADKPEVVHKKGDKQ